MGRIEGGNQSNEVSEIRTSYETHPCLINYHLIIENNLMILWNPLAKLLSWDMIFFYLTSCINASQPGQEKVSYIPKVLYSLYDDNKWQWERNNLQKQHFLSRRVLQMDIQHPINFSSAKHFNYIHTSKWFFAKSNSKL